jgi:hypothetical protein
MLMLYTIVATPFSQRNTQVPGGAAKGICRNMENEAHLLLTVVTVRGVPVKEPVDVFLANQTLTQNLRARAQSTPATIKGLSTFPSTYRIEVSAPCYQTVSQFINIPPNGAGTVTITLPVDASRIQHITAPSYDNLIPDARQLLADSTNVLTFEKKAGAELYTALDDVRRAGFLNLTAKANNTRFQNGRTVLSYITELLELRGDRFFAKTTPDLRSETTNAMSAQEFHEVSEALHDPTPGYVRDRSFKTMDHYGNLQLSFFKNTNGEYTVDMDIDDAQGFEHIFQVVRNITGPTNPYNIHEILLAAQHLDAGYDFILPEVIATA